jgi:hypothetical protein
MMFNWARGCWPLNRCCMCGATPSVFRMWEWKGTFHYCESCGRNFLKARVERDEEITQEIKVKAG